MVVVHFYAPFSVFYSMGRDYYRLMTTNGSQIIDMAQSAADSSLCAFR
ncbi:hypothetical protein MRBBS_2546 [Marinobacter sp. BSs20148]|nr:hypothetical protein MRBBS_2546 [Marinobacter sp. BSs20148]